MSRTVEQTVYTFAELSHHAQEHARERYRQGALDYEWWDGTYDYVDCAATKLGITIDRKRGRRMDGTPSGEPAIWFSGFCSQGDGARFEGRYAYVRGAAKAVRKEFPDSVELHRIADRLQAIQRRNFYRLEATMRLNGRYEHSGCMSVDVCGDGSMRDYGDVSESVCDDIVCEMRCFADWIYESLEKEHDWLMSDEQADESIMANEYEFDEYGDIA